MLSRINARLSGPLVASMLFFLYMPYLAKLIGPEKYSEFSFMLQILLFYSSLFLLKTDFNILYRARKDGSEGHRLPVFFCLLSIPLCLILYGYNKDVVFFLVPLSSAYLILYSSAVVAGDMTSIGRSEFIYKISLIVLTFIFVICGVNIIFAIAASILLRISFLYKNASVFFLNRETLNVPKIIEDLILIRWWVASQIVMLVGGFIPLLSIDMLFSARLFGFYLLSITVITGASSLIGKALADVFFEYTGDVIRLKQIMKKTYSYSFISFLIVFVVYFYMEGLVLYFLGDGWQGFHSVSMYILLLAYFSFLSNCFDKLPQYFRYEQYTLYFNLLRLIINGSVLALTLMLGFDFNKYLLIFTVSNILLYLFDVVCVFRIVSKNVLSI